MCSRRWMAHCISNKGWDLGRLLHRQTVLLASCHAFSSSATPSLPSLWSTSVISTATHTTSSASVPAAHLIPVNCSRLFSTDSKSASSRGSQTLGDMSSNQGHDVVQPGGGVTTTQQQRTWQQELQAVRAYVFEQEVGNGQRSGRKAIMKPLKGRYIADWYFTLTKPQMPMMENEVERERQERVELDQSTGSGPPKKGMGKRAKK